MPPVRLCRLTLIVLAGVVGVGAAPADLPSIRYRHFPGALCPPASTQDLCTDYVVTLDAEGAGTVEILRPNPSPPERFTTSPGQARTFRQALETYRPRRERLLDGGPPCGPSLTDADTVDIRWRWFTRREAHLRFYLACDLGDHGRMERAIRAAVRLLPLGDRLPPR